MRRYWRYIGYGCIRVLTLPSVVISVFLFFVACKYSVIAGETFGEVAFILTLTGIMCSPAIILIAIVLIHDHIVKKREKKIAKTEEERQRQQEEIKMLNVKIAETLRNSKKEKIIIKEK